MPSPLPEPVRRRRRRRVLAAIPTTLLSWAVVTGLPFTAAEARPGDLHTEILTLSGPDGQRTVAAGTSSRTLRSVPDEAATGWTASLDVDDGTQAVGPTWTGAPTGAVSVRGQEADGTWTPWQPLQSDPEDKPEADSRDAGGLAWFGHDGVDVVELRVDSGSLEDLELQTMRYEEPTSGSGAITAFAPAGAGAAAARPAIVPRSTWTTKGWATANSGCSGGPKVASDGLKFAVVHHTVNSNTYAASDVPALMASIYAYHTGSNGWCDIAYNFIVDRFGRIWEARSGGVDKAIVGGHAQGFNTGSVGVSFLGQYEPGASPTAAQPAASAITAAGQLIGWKLGLTGIDPLGRVTVTSGGSSRYTAGTVVTIPRVVGHRDLGYTACPGQNLYDELGDIRQIAKGYQGTTGTTTSTTTTAPPTTTTTTPPPSGPLAPFRTVEALVRQQYRDVLHREPSAGDLEFWSSRVGSSWTPGQFIANLLVSSEADSKVSAVVRLYRAYFLRNPDHAGLSYWLARRDEGRTITSISSSFARSSEFTSRYGKLGNAAFVDRVYRNIFGRPADPSGSTYWTKRLDAGTSRGQVMANFSQSSEYVDGTNAGVRVIATYEAMLDRAIEADLYESYERGIAGNSMSLTGIAGNVFASNEYRNRIL